MARPAQDPKVRFRKFVAQVESGCHEFQSTIQRDGYGRFYLDGRQAQAHRAAYQLFVGAIPAGKMVCHTCDNRRCVNLAHLFLGDAVDNVRDMHSKGRAASNRKVSDAQIKETLKLRAEGWTQERIGEVLGMDQTNVGRVLRCIPKYMNSLNQLKGA